MAVFCHQRIQIVVVSWILSCHHTFLWLCPHMPCEHSAHTLRTQWTHVLNNSSNKIPNKTVLIKHNLLSMPKFQPKVTDSNLHCQINPDLEPDVCQISPKMLWIHYLDLAGISHFATFCKNREVTVQEMLINLLKSRILQWWGKWKSDPELQ